MPSKSEPCGLSQMIASRYGAIPIVRETGGLYDSIKGYWVCDGEIRGNGFTFANYSSWELYDRICAAVTLYYDKAAFAQKGHDGGLLLESFRKELYGSVQTYVKKYGENAPRRIFAES